jgi:hypothetical protein
MEARVVIVGDGPVVEHCEQFMVIGEPIPSAGRYAENVACAGAELVRAIDRARNAIIAQTAEAVAELRGEADAGDAVG